MTKARDIAEGTDLTSITEPFFKANAVGDYLTQALNLNNAADNRVALFEMPGGKVPTGVNITGTFSVVDNAGNFVASVTTVALLPTAFNGKAAVQFNHDFGFSSSQVFVIEAASADATLTFTFA